MRATLSVLLLLVGLLLPGCYDLRPFDDDDVSGDDVTDDDDDATDDDDDDAADDDDDDDSTPAPDSDGDGINDLDEGDGDTDGDGIPDAQDSDSDGDGIPDADEAGDSDPSTPPMDSDGDGTPDFQDTDSDGDGMSDDVEGTVDSDGDSVPDYLDNDSDGDLISDAFEYLAGTDPISSDSDGDDTNDLIEQALGTDPLDPLDNPANNGDIVFVVPVRSEHYPSVDTVGATTNYQLVDLYVLMDHTGSMSEEISSMKDAAVDILNGLTCGGSGLACVEDADCASDEVCSLDLQCIQDPVVYSCVPSLWSGSGEFGGTDFPFLLGPDPTVNNQVLNPDPNVTADSIPGSTPWNAGGDERVFQSVECMADPSLCGSDDIEGCGTTGVGCPSFREGSARVLIQITDEPDQCGVCNNTAASAGAALMAANISYVGINALGDDSSPETQEDLEALALAAGSVDGAGEPFVRQGADAAVVAEVSAAVLELIDDITMDTEVQLAELPDDDGDAIPFIDRVSVHATATDLDGDGVADCDPSLTLIDQDGDGYDDGHLDVLPGIGVCWDVYPADNDWALETAEIQTFVAELSMRGNGAVLDVVNVWFVVPPSVPQ